jgi:predicted RNase H-like nuclease (RuvC/YqgF family)
MAYDEAKFIAELFRIGRNLRRGDSSDRDAFQVETAATEVARLLRENSCLKAEIDRLRAEVRRLTRELDEARAVLRDAERRLD